EPGSNELCDRGFDRFFRSFFPRGGEGPRNRFGSIRKHENCCFLCIWDGSGIAEVRFVDDPCTGRLHYRTLIEKGDGKRTMMHGNKIDDPLRQTMSPRHRDSLLDMPSHTVGTLMRG